jgi:TfoX/Sxy family transcriptional regulator of competence genes
VPGDNGKKGNAMAYDEAMAYRLRADMTTQPLVERKMFGGLAFLVHGHMVCGVHRGGCFFRVGKPNEARALSLPGVRQMDMAGRPMPGMVEVMNSAFDDEATRTALLALAVGFVTTLPPK